MSEQEQPTAAALLDEGWPVQMARRPVIAPANPADWSKTFKLKHPILVDGELLSAITVRRLVWSDVEALASESETEFPLPLRSCALMCGFHPGVFAGLSATDLLEIVKLCNAWLPPILLNLETA